MPQLLPAGRPRLHPAANHQLPLAPPHRSLFGKNAEALGHGTACTNCCLYCILSSVCGGTACLAAPLRGRLRASHNLVRPG